MVVQLPPNDSDSPCQSYRVLIGSDHAGFDFKESLKQDCQSFLPHLVDIGFFSSDRSDYPDIAHLMSLMIQRHEADRGILICGSGVGMAIAANRHSGIRAAVCWNEEVADLSRRHNDANVIVLGSRLTTYSQALECVQIFMKTPFEGGRHIQRVKKIELS